MDSSYNPTIVALRAFAQAASALADAMAGQATATATTPAAPATAPAAPPAGKPGRPRKADQAAPAAPPPQADPIPSAGEIQVAAADLVTRGISPAAVKAAVDPKGRRSTELSDAERVSAMGRLIALGQPAAEQAAEPSSDF